MPAPRRQVTGNTGFPGHLFDQYKAQRTTDGKLAVGVHPHQLA